MKDIRFELSILAKDLIYNIPSIAFAFVSASNNGDVILQNGNQSGCVRDVGDPGGELLVLEEIVAADQLAVLGSVGDKFVGACKVELALYWFNRLPPVYQSQLGTHVILNRVRRTLGSRL
jgi:hypothetical protein